MKKIPFLTSLVVLGLLLLFLFILEMILGSVDITISEVLSSFLGEDFDEERSFVPNIVNNTRLPRALTALFAGAGLGVSGLLMQTMFRNPLAGPSVLGITSGASLGVAVLILGTGGVLAHQWLGNLAISVAAMSGSVIVLLLILFVAYRLRDHVALLIFGLMIGYLSSGIVSVLQFGASKDALKALIYWGLGSFASTTWMQLSILIPIIILGLLFSFLFVKKLDVMLLGESYARTLGISFRRLQQWVILIAGIMTGIVTAYCGPVAFIGLSVPHVAKVLFRTTSHLKLVPLVILIGSLVGILCDLLSRMPWSDESLPLNAITSLIGAPVVLYIILRGSKLKSYF